MDKYKSILFVVKKGQHYSTNNGCSYAPTGLRNSAEFVVDMLIGLGVRAKLVQVIDNNDIDREVYNFKPDVVIIEALWVVPEKFTILKKLHPRVTWVVRIHSELPFLSQEGIAIEWIKKYAEQDKVFVGVNSDVALADMSHIVPLKKLLYPPNFYPTEFTNSPNPTKNDTIEICSFGAIRPLKNQLIQAVAAIAYADILGKSLNFHINGSRVENGEGALKNIRALFKSGPHKLNEHDWLGHSDFKKLLSVMDVSLCVSFTESFCIVAADTVSVGTPLVCSPEVRWASQISKCDPTDLEDILSTIDRVLKYRFLSVLFNKIGLKAYSNSSVKFWKNYLRA